MIKKTIFCITFIFVIICISNNKLYAISDKFRFLIDTIGIPQYNIYGEQINEEIYYTYNIFAYSSPNNLINITSQQRFKQVNNLGKWTKEGGSYKGYGTRGEYYVLGRSYSGSLIYNVLFPVDGIPETTPDRWNYIATYEAYESWFNKNLYKYEEQLNYMKNADMLFDEINYNNYTINPYNLVSYGLTPNKIGLDRVILNSCATWKTNGVLKVYRRDNRGSTKYAIFSTKPMAANANIKSQLDIDNDVVIKKDKDEVSIPIHFSANAVDLNEYAQPKHIKEIFSILYIDGKEVARVSGSKTVFVDKYINYTVSREKYKSPTFYNINFKVKSYLYTEFSVDGLLENEIEKVVRLKVEPKEIIPVKEVSLGILKENDKKTVVSPLVHNIWTKEASSQGIVEAGRYIALKLKLGIEFNSIDKFNCYIDDSKVDFKVIASKNDKIVIEIPVNKEIKNTMASWNYLRNLEGNYFDIDFSKIGSRVNSPHVIRLASEVDGQTYNVILKFDSIDSYEKNMNYIFDNNILNKEEIVKSKTIEEWLND